MGDSMLRRTGEAIVQSDLHDPNNTTKSLPIRMEHFKEMNARGMFKVAARSKVNDAIYPLVKYKLFLVQLDENYRTVLIRVGGTTQAAYTRRARGGVL